MAARRQTGFQRYVAKRMKDPSFAAAYRQARLEIERTDESVRSILRTLDAERERARMTKADLARLADMPPETVRKLFTARDVNPEISTINRLAAPLGLSLTLIRR